jgi:hypothetical protein
LIFLGVLVGQNILHDAMFGSLAAWFGEMFPTHVRYSGTSIGYQVGPVLGGGPLPLVATSLFFLGGNRPWLISAYFLLLCAMAIVAAVAAPETKGRRVTVVESPRPRTPSRVNRLDLPADQASPRSRRDRRPNSGDHLVDRLAMVPISAEVVRRILRSWRRILAGQHDLEGHRRPGVRVDEFGRSCSAWVTGRWRLAVGDLLLFDHGVRSGGSVR